MRRDERARFDALFEAVLEAMPPEIHELIEEVPVVLEDNAPRALLEAMGLDPEDPTGLCGLHSGVPLTDRSVDSGSLPDVITLYREGILEEAGGWDVWTDEDGTALGGRERVLREIRITLLHELGHHFGLDEDDLERLGYA
jgi:predicted Zn-dependent protease with MMP-like domain